MDPRGFSTTLPEFQKVFPDDVACAKYLEALRWTGGVFFPHCGPNGKAYSFSTPLPEFQKVFPDDVACAKYLEALRWTGGFICPNCGHKDKPYRFPSRSP